jgi:hypothetical protein
VRIHLLGVSLVLAAAFPGQAQIHIEAPAPPFDTFGEFRDFYVRGSFPKGVRHPGNLKVELFRGTHAAGTPVRVLESQVDPDGVTPGGNLETTFRDGTAWGGVDPAKVPDLIKAPGGLEDPHNKVMVTHAWFAAEIFGGVTRDFHLAYQDGRGRNLEDLAQGDYTLQVTGTSGDLLGQTATAVVHFTYQPKLLGRFSPETHLKTLKAYGLNRHYRFLGDSFPGFFKPDPDGNPTYEIPGRWRPNNALEIVNFAPGAHYGTARDVVNHVVLYNISAACVTEQVEIAAIVRANLAADPVRTEYLRYDLGEPELDYLDLDHPGRDVKSQSTFVPLDGGKGPAVCRIETGMADPGPDNEYRSAQVARKEVRVPAPPRALELSRSYAWAVFGVVPPIPSDLTPVPHLASSYTVDNRVARIHYELTGSSGARALTADRAVGLVRYFGRDAAPAAASIYEFKHVLKPPANLAPGSYHLTLTALDAHSHPVAGMTATLTVQVTP